MAETPIDVLLDNIKAMERYADRLIARRHDANVIAKAERVLGITVRHGTFAPATLKKDEALS